MAFPLINPMLQFFDNVGEPLARGKLFSYEPGSSTKKTTWQDEDLSTENSNPIVLDSAGCCTVFLEDGEEYKFVLSASTDTDPPTSPLRVRDEVKSPGALTQSQISAAIYPQTAAELAAGVTPTSYAYRFGDIRRYGAIDDGNFETGAGTDNSAAIQTAIDLCREEGGTAVYVPAGQYKCSSQVQVDDGLSIVGDGMWASIIFAPTAFANAGGLIRINGTTGYPTTISGVGVLAQVGGCTGAGIVSVKNGVFIQNVWVNGFTGGITLSSTDNYLHNFVVELCSVGIYVTDRHINITHGSVYRNGVGILIGNGAAVDVGRVHISGVRATQGDTVGFDLDGAKCVTFSDCSVTHVNGGKFVTAGLRMSNSCDDIIIDGFNAKLGTNSTAGIGILGSSSSNITITGGSTNGWLDGIQMSSIQNLSITGGQHISNARRGVYVVGGDLVNVDGVNAHTNGGAGVTDAGIYLDNTASFATYKITGCACSQAGGGVQEYGIFLSVTDNGANSGVTLVNGNVCTFNNTTQISYNGRTQNIIGSGNYPGYLPIVASAATITLAGYTDAFAISGTTNITAVTAATPGRMVTLVFQGALTFTDGSNLHLAGNFVTTTEDSITLRCDGTDWYEMSRSVN